VRRFEPLGVHVVQFRTEGPLIKYLIVGAVLGVALYVNTSGKAGVQIPHLPLGDDSSPMGRL
jgi:hypothetical protein